MPGKAPNPNRIQAMCPRVSYASVINKRGGVVRGPTASQGTGVSRETLVPAKLRDGKRRERPIEARTELDGRTAETEKARRRTMAPQKKQSKVKKIVPPSPTRLEADCCVPDVGIVKRDDQAEKTQLP